jgi:hypothetical protein
VKVGPGWLVTVTFPDRPEMQVSDFATEADAKNWMTNDSWVWLKKNGVWGMINHRRRPSRQAITPMEYRTLWGGVSVPLILRFYPERVETKKARGFKAWLGRSAKPAGQKRRREAVAPIEYFVLPLKASGPAVDEIRIGHLIRTGGEASASARQPWPGLRAPPVRPCAIPKDAIAELVSARGIPDLLDSIRVGLVQAAVRDSKAVAAQSESKRPTNTYKSGSHDADCAGGVKVGH